MVQSCIGCMVSLFFQNLLVRIIILKSNIRDQNKNKQRLFPYTALTDWFL